MVPTMDTSAEDKSTNMSPKKCEEVIFCRKQFSVKEANVRAMFEKILA